MTDIIDILIERLPEAPDSKISYVVYNDDHVAKTKELIDSIKGDGYCDKYCNVVSRAALNADSHASVYYDPRLLDHLGNGAN